MKLTIKSKAEKTDQYNTRIPVSLKQRLTTLAARASCRGLDLNATHVAVLEQLADELEARFDAEDRAVSNNPSDLLAPTPSSTSGVSSSNAAAKVASAK